MAPRPAILVLAGSTREGSFNRKLARLGAAAVERAGGAATLLELGDYPLPLFDQDLEARDGLPANALRKVAGRDTESRVGPQLHAANVGVSILQVNDSQAHVRA